MRVRNSISTFIKDMHIQLSLSIYFYLLYLLSNNCNGNDAKQLDSEKSQGIFQDLEYGGVSQLMGVKLFFSFHRGTLHIFKLQQNGR